MADNKKTAASPGKECYAKFMDGVFGGAYADKVKKNDWPEFRQNLLRLRCGAGLTQEQLAEMLGVSRTAVAKWEAGYGMPGLANLVTLAKLFGVSLDELVLGEPYSAENK